MPPWSGRQKHSKSASVSLHEYAVAAAPAEQRTIVYPGDYVDRGHDTRSVIERLIEGPPDAFVQVGLMGNHVSWLLDFLGSAHAGARPSTPLGDQDPENMVWIRDEFLETSAGFGAGIVQVHTIHDFPEERANRIGIDTGAFATGA